MAKKRGPKEDSRRNYSGSNLRTSANFMAAAPLSRTRACSARAEPPLQLDTDDHESDAIQLLLAIAAESDAMPAIEDGEPTSEEEDSSEEKEGS